VLSQPSFQFSDLNSLFDLVGDIPNKETTLVYTCIQKFPNGQFSIYLAR
jgi:hypothetical protein